MKLCIISHAYLEEGYLPVLEGIAAEPGIVLALITPTSYKRGVQNSSGDFSATTCNYKTYPVPIRWKWRQGTFLYQLAGIEKALKDFQPEIILHEQEVFALGAGQIAWLAAKHSIPLAMQVWENLDRSLSFPRRRIRQYVLRRCVGLTTASTGSAAVHRGWGFSGPIEVIPGMGVDALNPHPVYGRRSQGPFHVCYAGRLIPSKGIDCLLRAIATLLHLGIEVRCTIAGRGPEHDALLALAKALGISDVVTLTGILSPHQVIELLRASDVLVLPSRVTTVWAEQFGRILAEAMAQATITVGSKTGAIPEVIGSNELVFVEDDHRMLASILQRLATDVTFLRDNQRRLWERARDSYINSVLAERKVRFLRELLNGRTPVIHPISGHNA